MLAEMYASSLPEREQFGRFVDDRLGDTTDAVGVVYTRQDHGEFVTAQSMPRYPIRARRRRCGAPARRSAAHRPCHARAESLISLKRSRSISIGTIGRPQRLVPAPRAPAGRGTSGSSAALVSASKFACFQIHRPNSIRSLMSRPTASTEITFCRSDRLRRSGGRGCTPHGRRAPQRNSNCWLTPLLSTARIFFRIVCDIGAARHFGWAFAEQLCGRNRPDGRTPIDVDAPAIGINSGRWYRANFSISVRDSCSWHQRRGALVDGVLQRGVDFVDLADFLLHRIVLAMKLWVRSPASL